MQLKSLRLLVAVAETGSFGAAAKRLHTVQSNVTTHIKKLEEELSVKLIHRAGRVRPTSAGWALVEYAERMITAHDEAVSLFKGQVKACGRLRIGAMETTTALRLPPILAAYHAAQPDVDIQIKTGPTAELVELLLNGQVDCIFVAGRLEHGHYHSLKAFSEQLVLVGSTPMTQMPSSQALLTSAFLAFRQGAATASVLSFCWPPRVLMRAGSSSSVRWMQCWAALLPGWVTQCSPVARLKPTSTDSRFTRWNCPPPSPISIPILSPPNQKPGHPPWQALLKRCVTRWW